MTPDEILEYWFAGAERDPQRAQGRARFWFGGGPDVDAEIKARFGETLAQAERGELAGWTATARGRLALIVLLDQFTRNAHRGSPRMFASDGKARALVREGLDNGHADALAPVEQLFFFMPLMHSEDLADHDLGLPRFERLAESMPPELRELGTRSLDFARRHRAVIERFGRYPSRNAAMSRTSTDEEMQFLQNGPGW